MDINRASTDGALGFSPKAGVYNVTIATVKLSVTNWKSPPLYLCVSETFSAAVLRERYYFFVGSKPAKYFETVLAGIPALASLVYCLLVSLVL